MKLRTKIVLAAGAAVVATVIASEIAVYLVAKENRINELRGVMDMTIRQAEQVRSQFETIHQERGIDLTGLAGRARTENGGKSVRESYVRTALYNTIPIVASWQSVQEMARFRKFTFDTPAAPDSTPRNAKNKPGANLDPMFKAFKEGQKDYFHYDRARGELVFGRPVFLSQSCLICHGSPEGSPTKDGMDFVGFPMENMKAGDLRGAFVLTAPMTQDPVMRATMSKIMIVGLLALGLATAGFFVLNQRIIIRPLHGAIAQISASGEQTSQAASEIRQAGRSLADAASQQAASLEQTSASLEEMSGMTQHTSESANQVKDLAGQARAAADAGAKDMQEMNGAMNDIKTASAGIDKIIKTIDEIAFQTNILALNAAVEAARAGEAGLGFAVVADEVRNLAQRCALAAKETAQKIDDAIAKSERGVQISAKTAQSLEEIVAKIRKVDELVAQIASASSEQTQGIVQINSAVADMDRVTQNNAAMAEESSAASEELYSQAGNLKKAVHGLFALVEGDTGSVASTAARNVPSLAAKPKSAAAKSSKAAPAFVGGSSGAGQLKPDSAPVRQIVKSKPSAIPMEGDFKDF
jgi:methyl-accepting chemotaxis protein